MINLWLDDVRPAPIGWTHVKTVGEAKLALASGQVHFASLDHDLGACEECMKEMAPESGTADEWLAKTNYKAMPNCPHFGTGYDLVSWMEETGTWPARMPLVHSANPVGRARMEQVILKEWSKR